VICSLFDGSQVKREHIKKGICTFLYNQENLIFALQETLFIGDFLMRYRILYKDYRISR